jgi:hypothetical protein
LTADPRPERRSWTERIAAIVKKTFLSERYGHRFLVLRSVPPVNAPAGACRDYVLPSRNHSTFEGGVGRLFKNTRKLVTMITNTFQRSSTDSASVTSGVATHNDTLSLIDKSSVADVELEGLLTHVGTALDVYRKHEGTLSPLELSLKSILTVLQAHVAEQLAWETLKSGQK